MLTCAKTRACRNGGQERNLNATTEGFELLTQSGVAFLAKAGQKADEGECGLRNREGRTYFIILAQFFVRGDGFHSAQVDGAAHDDRLLAGLYIDLKRRLSVHFDSKINHISPCGETIRRRVAPTASHVNAHTASCPYDLVGSDRRS